MRRYPFRIIPNLPPKRLGGEISIPARVYGALLRNDINYSRRKLSRATAVSHYVHYITYDYTYLIQGYHS